MLYFVTATLSVAAVQVRLTMLPDVVAERFVGAVGAWLSSPGAGNLTIAAVEGTPWALTMNSM